MVIVFDVLGTLLNTGALAPIVRKVTNGQVSAHQYAEEVTTYAMASSLAGVFEPYEVIASSVLRMKAQAYGNELRKKELEAFGKRLYSLPPHPEVKNALKQLYQRGLRLAALSNAGPQMLKALLSRANLDRYFEKILSTEAVQRYKPAQEAYQFAIEKLGGGPHESIMVAAHPWDLLGAAHAGYRTALIERRGQVAYPSAPEPNYVARDIQDFANKLLGVPQESSGARRGWLLAGCGVALGLAGTVAVNATASVPVNATSADKESPVRVRSAAAGI